MKAFFAARKGLVGGKSHSPRRSNCMSVRSGNSTIGKCHWALFRNVSLRCVRKDGWRLEVGRVAPEVKNNSMRFLEQQERRLEVRVRHVGYIDVIDEWLDFFNLGGTAFLQRVAGFELKQDVGRFPGRTERLDLQVYSFALVASGKILQRAIANPLLRSTGNEGLSISQGFTCVVTIDFQNGIASRDPGSHCGGNGGDHQLSFNPIPTERQSRTLKALSHVAMPVMQSRHQVAERSREGGVILVRRRAFESPP